MPRVSTLCAALLAAALLLLSPAARAQDTLLEIRSAGLKSMEVSEKDRAFVQALGLMGARILDFEGELEGFGPGYGEMGEMLWEVFSGPMALKIVSSDAAPGFGLSLTAVPDPEKGVGWTRATLMALLENLEIPFEDDGETARIMSPVGPALLTQLETASGPGLRLMVGAPHEAGVAPETDDLPDGMTPVISYRADVAKVMGMIAPMLGDRLSPEDLEALEEFGLAGEDAPIYTGVVGIEEGEMRMTFRTVGASAEGVSPDSMFTAEDLRIVPHDATRALAFSFDLTPAMDPILQRLDEEAGDLTDPGREIMELFAREMMPALGQKFTVYLSDSTGGGGWMSMVAAAQLRDPDGFENAFDTILAKIEESVAASEAAGYVRIRKSQSRGREMYSFQFPGLPVPISPAWAIEGDRFFLAMTAPGLEAALTQARRGSRSLLDQRGFTESAGEIGPGDKFTSLYYSDTARFAQRGYGNAVMLGTALSNGVSSTKNPDRVGFDLVPPYAEFGRDVLAFTLIGRWEGVDHVHRVVMDESMLVQAASLGSSAGPMSMPAMAAGVMLPALGKARQSARQLKSQSQVRGVVMAAITYAGNNDTAPESFDELIDSFHLTEEMLASPYGTYAEGERDLAFRFDLGLDGIQSFDPNLIVCIDRSQASMSDEGVLIGFADSRVELVEWADLQRYLDMPQNKGAMEALGFEGF